MSSSPQTTTPASASTGRLTRPQTARAAHITPLRLAPYVTAASGDRSKAVTLYEWNIATSAAVYEVLHRFEVGLRNAMDPRLCAWNATQVDETGRQHGRDWLIDPSRLLARLAAKSINDATPRARRAVAKGGVSRAMLHDDVLAATSLGTWRYLLPDKDPGRQLLWKEAVHAAFPCLPTSSSGDDVTREVKHVLTLRNRVAHLEPLLDVSRTQRQVSAAYKVAGWIDPHLRDWLTSTQRVTAAFRARATI